MTWPGFLRSWLRPPTPAAFPGSLTAPGQTVAPGKTAASRQTATVGPAAIDPDAARLRDHLSAAGLAVTVRITRNRRVALSLGGRPGAWRLGIHRRMVDDHDCLAALPAWIAAHGRGRHPGIRAALNRLAQTERERALARLGPAPVCEPVGASVDLAADFQRIHATWFSDIPPPTINWSRDTGGRQLRQIRYGSYRRGDPARIMIHPRLAQPWVARVFLDHVLWHELCHHRQALTPISREKPHSARFRAWERTFPDHALAMRWERHHRLRLLGASGPESGADP